MEFPNLGQNCSVKVCKQLDFLPIKCDLCSQTFCTEHFRYESHSCPNAYIRENQVPICPLCNQPIPVKRGELPDIRVGQHIDLDCKSDPALKKRNAIYTNKCSLKSCKQKELMPLICNDCGLNHCLRHRHSADHNCKPNTNAKLSKSGSAALKRFNQNKSVSTNIRPDRRKTDSQPIRSHTNNAIEIQGNFSEDEALARALEQSMIENRNQNSNLNSKSSVQDLEDRHLAEAIAESQRDIHKPKDKCQIS